MILCYAMRLAFEVSVPARNTRGAYIHFWTLRASTHERPLCVIRHTGNAYSGDCILTHTSPSDYRDGVHAFNAAWTALHTLRVTYSLLVQFTTTRYS